MKTLVIIPAKNAYKTILDVVAKINALYEDIDVLVVDFGSTDRTKHLLRNNDITHLEYFVESTYNAAVSTGLEYAYQNDYKFAIQWDALDRFDPNDIAYAIRTFEENKLDFILGSRYIDKKASFWNRSTRAIGRNIKIFTRKTITDPRLRFRGYGRNVMKLFRDSNYFDPGIETVAHLAKVGYKYLEIQVNAEKLNKIENNKGIINISRATLLVMFTKPFKKVGK